MNRDEIEDLFAAEYSFENRKEFLDVVHEKFLATKEKIDQLLGEHYDEVIKFVDTKRFDAQLDQITELFGEIERTSGTESEQSPLARYNAAVTAVREKRASIEAQKQFLAIAKYLEEVNKLHRDFSLMLFKNQYTRAAQRLFAEERLLQSYDARFATLTPLTQSPSTLPSATLRHTDGASREKSEIARQSMVNEKEAESTTAASSTATPSRTAISSPAKSKASLSPLDNSRALSSHVSSKPPRPFVLSLLEERLQAAKKDFLALVQALLRDCARALADQDSGLILIDTVSALRCESGVLSVPLLDILSAANSVGLLKEAALTLLDEAQRQLDLRDARAGGNGNVSELQQPKSIGASDRRRDRVEKSQAKESSISTAEPSDVLQNVDGVRIKVRASESQLVDVPLFDLEHWLESNYRVTGVVETHSLLFADKLRQRVLVRVRQLILSEDFVTADGGKENEGAVTANMHAIGVLLDGVLSLLTGDRPRPPSLTHVLVEIVTDIVMLVHSLVPRCHSEKISKVAQITCLYFNSLVYLGQILRTANTNLCLSPDSPLLDASHPLNPHLALNKLMDLLEDEAESTFQSHIAMLREEIESTVSAQAFQDIHRDAQFMSTKRELRQVSVMIQRVNATWESTTSLPLRTQATRAVITCFCHVLVRRILGRDLTRDEARKNSILLLKSVSELEDHFKPAIKISQLVRTWGKLSLLAEMLKGASLAEIVDRFNAGKLDVFAREEVVLLIKSMFADSEARESKLKALKYLEKK